MYTFACTRRRCLYVCMYLYIYIYMPAFLFLRRFWQSTSTWSRHQHNCQTSHVSTSAGVLSTSGTGIKKLCIVSPAWSNNQTRHQPRNYSINLCFYDFGNSRDDRNFKFKRGAVWTSNRSNPPALPACLVEWGLMMDCLSALCFCTCIV